MGKTKKAINFDLNTAELKKVFGTNNPFKLLEGYKEIERYLKKNGFTHRQWSGYISNEPMSDSEITSIVRRMNQQIPWIKDCVRKFDVTNIGKTFDLTHIFKGPNKEDKTILPDKSQSTDSVNNKNSRAINSVFTRSDLKRSAAKISKESRNISQPAHHKNDIEL